ncbi:MAG: VWA domain-containing protein [Pseudomonadales bacterium]
MAKRRDSNVFSLSFLDIMSCGFGAVILIFIVIKHGSEATPQESNLQLMAEVRKIEEQITDESEKLVVLRNTITEQDSEIATTEEAIRAVIEEIKVLEAQISALQDTGASKEQTVEELKSEIKELEEEAASLKSSVENESGVDSRSFIGAGDRQYLSGVHLGGEHILIMLDTSASMLDNTIVNVVRRRNMSDAQKLEAPKWQRALATIQWVVANIPRDANVQLVTFNEQAEPAVTGTEGTWIKAEDREKVDRAIDTLKQTIPKGGTSLHHPFALSRALSPQPDSIFLIVDSLPTLGLEPARNSNITGRDRIALFRSALNELPGGIPVTVILFPMEGDPIAAPSYWRLAQITGGAFLSPPEDWP